LHINIEVIYGVLVELDSQWRGSLLLLLTPSSSNVPCVFRPTAPELEI